MGIFSKFFSGQSDYEDQLQDSHTQMFQLMMGMSASEARVAAKNLIRDAKKELKRSGEGNLPPSWGDLLLIQEATDSSLKEKFGKNRAEGVSDDDIRWFYNLPPIERKLIEMADQTIQMAHLLAKLDSGLTQREAADAVRKFHPIFGDPTDTAHTIGDDRPLPPELFNRVNNYRWERLHKDKDS